MYSLGTPPGLPLRAGRYRLVDCSRSAMQRTVDSRVTVGPKPTVGSTAGSESSLQHNILALHGYDFPHASASHGCPVKELEQPCETSLTEGTLDMSTRLTRIEWRRMGLSQGGQAAGAGPQRHMPSAVQRSRSPRSALRTGDPPC